MKNKNINSISNGIDRKLLLILSVIFAFLLFVICTKASSGVLFAK